jgi:hypothetical protein
VLSPAKLGAPAKELIAQLTSIEARLVHKSLPSSAPPPSPLRTPTPPPSTPTHLHKPHSALAASCLPCGTDIASISEVLCPPHDATRRDTLALALAHTARRHIYEDTKCWLLSDVQDSNKRPSASNLRDHPWLEQCVLP